MHQAVDKRVLVKADLNQMELRVLAAITEDENMLDVFRIRAHILCRLLNVGFQEPLI